jgi:hypothetical protein
MCATVALTGKKGGHGEGEKKEARMKEGGEKRRVFLLQVGGKHGKDGRARGQQLVGKTADRKVVRGLAQQQEESEEGTKRSCKCSVV